jgi:hypothetical protein
MYYFAHAYPTITMVQYEGFPAIPGRTGGQVTASGCGLKRLEPEMVGQGENLSTWLFALALRRISVAAGCKEFGGSDVCTRRCRDQRAAHGADSHRFFSFLHFFVDKASEYSSQLATFEEEKVNHRSDDHPAQLVCNAWQKEPITFLGYAKRPFDYEYGTESRSCAPQPTSASAE